MSVHPFRFRASYGNTAGVFRVEPSQTRLWVPDMTVCAMLSEPREPVSVRPGSLHCESLCVVTECLVVRLPQVVNHEEDQGTDRDRPKDD